MVNAEQLAAPADREWSLRPYAVGLLRNEPVAASMVAFVLLVMAAVLFDGVLATPAWQAFEERLLAVLAPAGDFAGIIARTLGLVGVWLLFLGAYGAIAALMAAAIGWQLTPGAIARRFVFTRSPAFRGISAGATTSQLTRDVVTCHCRAYPHGPAS